MNNKYLLIILGLIALAVLAFFYLGNREGPVKPDSADQAAKSGEKEKTNDCFIAKQGDAKCIIDATDMVVERASNSGECEGLRATITFDTEMTALDPKQQGEVVLQIHPKGEGNDGSADTGVGMGHYSGGRWLPFSFGPGDSEPADGTFAGEVKDNTVTLELYQFADGSCITDDDEMRLKAEMTDAAGNRVYDLVGTSDLTEYAPISFVIKGGEADRLRTIPQ